MQAIKIRQAQVSDATTIARIHAQSWRNTYAGDLDAQYLAERLDGEREQLWQARLTAPAANQYVWLAENEVGALGFCCLYTVQDGQKEMWGSYIDNLHVVAEAQQGGIGVALLAQVRQFLLDGYSQQGVYLFCNQSNTQARYFYQRRGGVEQDEIIWQAPDGSSVPAIRIAWSQVHDLMI